MARIVPFPIRNNIEQRRAHNHRRISRKQCKLNTRMWNCFESWQRKPDNESLEKKFQVVVNRGADLLSTHPTQQWYFTPLHQAAYAGNVLIVRRLVKILHEKGLLKANLKTEAHPRGLGEHGYPVELARESSEIARFLRNASQWRFRQRIVTLMLCIASHNTNASRRQAWGSVSVIGLLYREWAAMKSIMQFIVPAFAIGDVVRTEITTNNRTKFLYGSIRQRRKCRGFSLNKSPVRWDYIVAYHEDERQEEQDRDPKSIVPITSTALRSPDQLFTESFDSTRYEHQLQTNWENRRARDRGWNVDRNESSRCSRAYGCISSLHGLFFIFVLSFAAMPILYLTGSTCPFPKDDYFNMTKGERVCVTCAPKLNRFVVVEECCRTCVCMSRGECKFFHEVFPVSKYPGGNYRKGKSRSVRKDKNSILLLTFSHTAVRKKKK